VGEPRYKDAYIMETAVEAPPNFFIEIAVVLIAAKVGGHVAKRFGQASVLGELSIGILLGTFAPFVLPITTLPQIATAAGDEGSHLNMLAQVGVVLLLFGVGLETRVGDLLRVGGRAMLVALIGVVMPVALGYYVSSWAGIDTPVGVDPSHTYLFVGATLAATSVGVTARILEDLQKTKTRESRIILGAAVVDDVLGLVLLAALTGVVIADRDGAAVSIWQLGLMTSIQALLFAVVALFAGLTLGRYYFRAMARLRGEGVLLASAVAFCFILAFFAHVFGLATIIGAFIAGLAIGDEHIRPFRGRGIAGNQEDDVVELRKHMSPLSDVLVPIFFVLMGFQVRLEALFDTRAVGFVVLLTIAAIVGKIVCGFAAPGSIRQRLTVGIGMLPRGEVGLIFAAIGRGLGVIGDATFSAIVVIVLISTLMTPLLLTWNYAREEAAAT